MKKNTLKIITVALVAIITFSSCATKKKYGCPSHISIFKMIGL